MLWSGYILSRAIHGPVSAASAEVALAPITVLDATFIDNVVSVLIRDFDVVTTHGSCPERALFLS